MASALNGAAQIPQHPALQRQSMPITAGSTTLPLKFTAQTRFIKVHTDAICSTAIGTVPVAVTTADRMPADLTTFEGVNPGDNLAVIANT
jgi:hypothetical protein